jgi:integrase
VGRHSLARQTSAVAGLSRITFHDLRHSYATGALKAGISPKVVSDRIGHANVGFFLQTYAHVADEAVRVHAVGGAQINHAEHGLARQPLRGGHQRTDPLD